MKEIFGWLKEALNWKAGWRYARTIYGVQFVIIDGTRSTPQLFVDSLVSQWQVTNSSKMLLIRATECRLLPSYLATLARTGSPFGHGAGPIHYSQFACNGLEARLADCSSGVRTSYCTHSTDAGVRCHTQIGVCII